MSDSFRVEKLRATISTFESVIAGFERTRERMQLRRHGATDSVMVELDESLRLNERTLTAVRRAVETTKEELKRELAPGNWANPVIAPAPPAIPTQPVRDKAR